MKKAVLFILALMLAVQSSSNEDNYVEYRLKTDGSVGVFPLKELLVAESNSIADHYIEVLVDTTKRPATILLKGDREGVERILSLSDEYTFEFEEITSSPSDEARALLSSVELFVESTSENLINLANSMLIDGETLLPHSTISEVIEEFGSEREDVFLNEKNQRRIDVLSESESLSEEYMSRYQSLVEQVIELKRFIDFFTFFDGNMAFDLLQGRSNRFAARVNQGPKNSQDISVFRYTGDFLRRGGKMNDFFLLGYLMETFEKLSGLNPNTETLKVFKIYAGMIIINKVHLLMEKAQFTEVGIWNSLLARFLADGKSFDEARSFFQLDPGDELLDLILGSEKALPTIKHMALSLSWGEIEIESDETLIRLNEMKVGVQFDPSISSNMMLVFTDRFSIAHNQLLDSSWVPVFKLSTSGMNVNSELLTRGFERELSQSSMSCKRLLN